MKHQLILILALTLTQATYSQKITTFTDPATQTRWLMTDVADLNPMLNPATEGLCYVNFRAAGDLVNLYLQGRGVAIGPKDFIAFIMDKDTVVVHSTGAQPGGPVSTHGGTHLHEYAVSRDDLSRLSRGGNLNQVLVSDYLGMQEVKVFNHHDRLAAYAAALLKAMGN